MFLLNTDTNEYKKIELVTGTSTCTGMKAITKEMNEWIKKIKENAIIKMKEEAQKLNADGIINIRFNISISESSYVVLVSGTAVKK